MEHVQLEKKEGEIKYLINNLASVERHAMCVAFLDTELDINSS